ncbi:MAG: hypothetical protein AAFQ22_07080 [Pseudomonadota bacterium]
MRMKGRARTPNQFGDANPSAKLCWDDVNVIRARIKEGHTNRAIAADYPVSEAMISRIKKNDCWPVEEGPNQ